VTNWELIYRHQVHVIGLNIGVLMRCAPLIAGQPAAVAYTRDAHGTYRPYGICVLTVTSEGIRRVTSFGEPGLVALFG